MLHHCLLLVCLVGLAAARQAEQTRQYPVEEPDSALASLLSPNRCHLKLICAIARRGSPQLNHSPFMHGIEALSGGSARNRTVQEAVLEALQNGRAGRPCTAAAPLCPHSERDLLLAAADLGLGPARPRTRVRRQVARLRRPSRHFARVRLPRRRPAHRRQGLLPRLPPVFRPDEMSGRAVCRQCDTRSTVCTVYSIGTYAGCTGVFLVGGVPAQFACNMATAPGSLGCTYNTFHCYMEGCGLINLPRLNLPRRTRLL